MIDFLMSHLRARCVTSPALLVWVLVYNLWIARSYLPIGWRLMRLRSRAGGHIFQHGEVRLLAVFIASCGVTHVFVAAALFFPVLDWPAVVWGVWTGLVSARARRTFARSETQLLGFLLGYRRLYKKVHGVEAEA